MAKKEYDIIIVGSGPAGLTASIYSIRSNHTTLVIAGSTPGGQLMITTDVDDFPGFPGGIQGPELMAKMRKQAELLGVHFVDEDVTKVDLKGKTKKVWAEKKMFSAKAVIIATGASARWLGLDSEKRLMGKGVSACAVCVTPDTQVITNPNVKAIGEVSEQDKVLTHKGRFQHSYIVGSRDYNGDLIMINPYFFYGKLRLTQEHEVLAARKMKSYGYRKFLLRCKYGNNVNKHFHELGLKPDWIPAGHISKGDFLFYPIINKTQDVTEIKISDIVDCRLENGCAINNKETHTAVRVPDKIRVDEDFMTLCGYYISEGSGGKQLDIYFNKNETEYIRDVKKIIKKIFGLDVYMRDNGASVTHIECFSKIVGNFFKGLFGADATNKHLPQWMLTLPINKQVALFKTLWRGDGSTKRATFHYVTSSKLLCEQLKAILLRVGVIPHTFVKTVEHQNKVIHKINGRPITARHDKYEIEVGGPWLGRLSKMLGVKHPLLNSRGKTNYHGWLQGGYAVLPIRDVKKERYNGLVYNLAVGIDNSYTTTNACVHNCDGFAFKGKDVIVIGGGDTAMREALFLSKICKTVTVVHRRDKLKAQAALQDKAERTKNIKWIWNSGVEEFLGKDKLESVMLSNYATNKTSEIKVQGAFVAIGHKPNTEFLKGQVNLDDHGYVSTQDHVKTNVGGVFVAGDVHDYKYMQAVTAAGAGCMAAMDARDYLEDLKHKKK